ncbi:peptidylprolyl isomerase [Amaricoccus sp.]|uniref:peptidylprolyl isomerase n=1 Tax=Amaricoccus sp. TaxID=1872485 RepID=UPI002618A433|nr:peptidylprolyl isomerase [Amaricoccus sp.]HRO12042.1 peptidylprolyl isomerase [Amaricoccus sp.]
MLRLLLVVATLALAGPGAGPALAQNPFAPAIMVNNGVITNYDIDQRMRLLEALGANGDLRKLAVQQLTEDRVKLQAAEEMQIELPEGAIEAGIEEFAAGRGLTMDDVQLALDARGIDQQTMDDFVESGLLWRDVIGTRFRARASPTEADLDAALEIASRTPQEVLTLAEIALPYAELGPPETDALAERLYRQLAGGASFAALAAEYSRSASAENGGLLEPVAATNLPPAFRSEVLLLRPGQVTRPIPISGGVAIIKLVSIRQVPPQPIDANDPEVREQLRQRLFSERILSFGQGYLQELLGDAIIVER